MGYIYSLSDPRTGELRYVGKTKHTLQYRLASHLCPSSRNKHSYLSRWLLSLHGADLKPCIETLEAVDEDKLNARERHWIAGLRATGHRLINGTDGGDGVSYWTGKKRSPETVEKTASKLRGRRYPNRKKSPPMTPEHRAKLAAAGRGRTHSPATRKFLAEKARQQVGAKNGKWRPVDLEYVRRRRDEGASFRQIARELGTNHPILVRHFRKTV